MKSPSNRPSPLRDVFEKLRKLGLSESYVRARALPSWWNDEIAETPLGRIQAIGYLAVLGVDGEALLSENNTPAQFLQREVLWKTARNVGHSDLELVKGLCSQAAEICTRALPESSREMATSAQEWRARLIDRAAEVNFEAWLDECWECGIAVLSVTAKNLPPNAKKPHGLAANFGERGVIVLTGAEKQTAWQLFRGLHETGHLARGHLRDEQILIDRDLKQNLDDPREKEADAFATEVLYGSALAIATEGEVWLNAHDLAKEAQMLSDKLQVEPGALLLNWAKTMTLQGSEQNCWATAQTAIQTFPSPDAHALMREKLAASLLWDELSENQAAFVRSLCGINELSSKQVATA